LHALDFHALRTHIKPLKYQQKSFLDTYNTPMKTMECRPHCAACCIAPSISSPIPGMQNGKPAGIPCIQLTSDLRCAIFGRPERPACCSGLQASEEMCGDNKSYAMLWLTQLEKQTAPGIIQSN
jgi:hypothetical protein